MKLMVAAVMMGITTAAQATALTIRPGESWVFTIKNGQPTNAQKVPATAKPPTGQVTVSVRALFGTTMVATNNSSTSYTFNAELITGKKAVAARTCTLPGGAKPTLEQWDQKADAVRISNFQAAGDEGRC